MMTHLPLEQLQPTLTAKRRVTIGLPSAKAAGDSRFPITPEAAALIIGQGYDIKMEAGAAVPIHYGDVAYARAGVEITSRAEALKCDIVVYLPAMSADDARQLKNGAMLLSLLDIKGRTAQSVEVHLTKHIIAIALDLVTDVSGHHPFADILAEIDGRAAIAVASSLLADATHGKGILLGGIAGIVPCEVTIIGSSIAARAAAASAIGMGAMVRIFDNDIYRLRETLTTIGSAAIGSAMYPKVLMAALRSADIVIVTDTERDYILSNDIISEMKRGVVVFDLTAGAGHSFPGMRCVDLGAALPGDDDPVEPTRTCYVNAGSAVPRTTAMAISNTIAAMLADIAACDGVTGAVKFNAGIAKAAYTFLGKPVNGEVARIAGLRSIDINLLLQLS